MAVFCFIRYLAISLLLEFPFIRVVPFCLPPVGIQATGAVPEHVLVGAQSATSFVSFTEVYWKISSNCKLRISAYFRAILTAAGWESVEMDASQ